MPVRQVKLLRGENKKSKTPPEPIFFPGGYRPRLKTRGLDILFALFKQDYPQNPHLPASLQPYDIYS